MPLVKAIQKGFDGMQIRQPGEVFEFGGNIEKSKWLVPASKKAKAFEPDEDVEVEAEVEAEEAPKAAKSSKAAKAAKAKESK